MTKLSENKTDLSVEKILFLKKKALWIVIGGTLVLVVLLFWLLGAKIQQQVSQLQKHVPNSAQELKEKIGQYEWGRQVLDNTGDLQKQLSSKSVIKTAGGFFRTTFGVFGDIYVILFIGIFFTANPSLYKNTILALIPKRGKDRGEEVLDKLGLTLRDWLVGKLFAMVVVAVLTAIGLSLLGVPMALALALIAGILNFVPNFGPLIAMIPAVLVALSQGTTTALIVAGLYLAIQMAESNFITPMVQQRLIQIPPAFIIIGQVTMGILTGALGLILATPFLAIIMVLVQELYIQDALHDGSTEQSK